MQAKPFTKLINELQRQHPGSRRQRSSHGAGRYSVQFFDKQTGRLVGDYNLSKRGFLVNRVDECKH